MARKRKKNLARDQNRISLEKKILFLSIPPFLEAPPPPPPFLPFPPAQGRWPCRAKMGSSEFGIQKHTTAFPSRFFFPNKFSKTLQFFGGIHEMTIKLANLSSPPLLD